MTIATPLDGDGEEAHTNLLDADGRGEGGFISCCCGGFGEEEE